MPAPATPSRDQLFEIGKITLAERIKTAGNGFEHELNNSEDDVEMVVERHTALVTQLQRQRDVMESLEVENHMLKEEIVQLQHASRDIMQQQASTDQTHDNGAASSDDSAVILELKQTLEKVRQNVQVKCPCSICC